MSNFADLALRTAVNTASREISGDGSQVTKLIKDTAQERVKTLVQGTCNGSSVQNELASQGNLISGAIQVLSLAYSVANEQFLEMKRQRLGFDKERIAKIASFIIPSNIVQTDLSVEQAVVRSFIEEAKRVIDPIARGSYIYSYLGIHEGKIATDSCEGQYYSVMPFYRMSQEIIKAIPSANGVDEARDAINLFFSSAIEEVIDNIDLDFQQDSRPVAWASSVWQSMWYHDNYLNNRRAPRFIIISLGNLLWNLQHPVDLTSGFPLSMEETLEVCRLAELFLNKILDPKTSPEVEKIATKNNQLLSVIEEIEVYIKSLRSAYQYQQLHELNVADINHTGHHTLRTMDQSLLRLIYKKRDPITDQPLPDDRAASTIAFYISHMNKLIHLNKDRSILKIFDAYRHLVKDDRSGLNTAVKYVNDVPLQTLTMIDVLIIFCHMESKDRNELRKALKQLKLDNSLEFANMLKKLYSNYIEPIEAIVAKQKDKKLLFGSDQLELENQSIATQTARRIIPFFALVLADYRINLDIDWPYINMHWLDSMPATADEIPNYKGSYVFKKTNPMSLYYVDSTGIEEPVDIKNMKALYDQLMLMNPNQLSQFSLTKTEVNKYVTSDSGHIPEYVNVDVIDGTQQIQQINMAADGKHPIQSINISVAATKAPYYFWSLSSLLDIKKGPAQSNFDQFPKFQYEMTQMTQLMDEVLGLISEYHHFLQLPDFQRFLMACLNQVKDKYKVLDQKVAEIDHVVSDSEQITRSLYGHLRPMLSALDRSLRGFTHAISTFQRVLSSPDFVKKQRNVMRQKLLRVWEQYIGIFGVNELSDTLGTLISKQNDLTLSQSVRAHNSYSARRLGSYQSALPASLPAAVRSSVATATSIGSNPRNGALFGPSSSLSSANPITRLGVNSAGSRAVGDDSDTVIPNPAAQVLALKNLAKRCLSSMSYFSQKGVKGERLQVLIKKLDKTPTMKRADIEAEVFSLTQIVSCYRRNGFFSAGYGQTRSAQPLLEALKNTALNRTLPIASILFERDVSDVTELNSEAIQHQLQGLRIKKHWNLSC